MKDLLIEKLYEASKKPYQKYFKKNEPWGLSRKELLGFEEKSLGFHLGCFLLKHDFQIQEKLEDHDAIHILTNTGVSVVEEIGMQYYLLGNGKKSLYLYMVVLSGTVFYPTKFKSFLSEYKRGKQALEFHYLDFYKMLNVPVSEIQNTFKIK
ncbi:hypothetical protein ACI6PS_09725 [Flavobacterium sp. PLA-1-15]|uniref:hypothetical protein n=1 Tax=Flavobacterium sp. PLA-1-15 TaxID=3380533 RepID=UPI003B7A6E23